MEQIRQRVRETQKAQRARQLSAFMQTDDADSVAEPALADANANLEQLHACATQLLDAPEVCEDDLESPEQPPDLVDPSIAARLQVLPMEEPPLLPVPALEAMAVSQLAPTYAASSSHLPSRESRKRKKKREKKQAKPLSEADLEKKKGRKCSRNNERCRPVVVHLTKNDSGQPQRELPRNFSAAQVPNPDHLNTPSSSFFVRDARGKQALLLCVLRKGTSHNPVSAELVEKLKSAVHDLDVKRNNKLFHADSRRRSSAAHFGVWEWCDALAVVFCFVLFLFALLLLCFFFLLPLLRSPPPLLIHHSSYQKKSYLIRGTESDAAIEFLREIQPLANALSAKLASLDPLMYDRFKTAVDAIPDRFRYAVS